MLGVRAKRDGHQQGPRSPVGLSARRRGLSLHLGSLLLRSVTVRASANWASRHLGPSAAAGLNYLFGDARIVREFQWRCEFRDRTFLLPVFPELQRSWHNAWQWRWGWNRSIRRFYEWYLRNRPEGTLFDVGANDGTHSYPFAAYGYRCVCFEPQESCLAYIRKVRQLNRFDALSIEDCVVSNRDLRALEFFAGESSWYSSLARDHVLRWGDAPRRMVVRSVTLDSICRVHGLRPTMVKIDVEGSEWDVLEGATETFHESRPDALIEVTADAPRRARIWAFFQALEYSCYWLPGDARRPVPVSTEAEFLAGDGESPFGDYAFVIPSRFPETTATLVSPGDRPGFPADLRPPRRVR